MTDHTNWPHHLKPPFSPRRPPWWPEDEPWPPPGPFGRRMWHRRRGKLFLRVAALALLVFIFIFGSCALMFWIAVNSPEWIRPHMPMDRGVWGPRIASVIALIIGILGVIFTVRALRQIASRFGDLMEATGRVEAGDYSTRLTEHGPREMRSMAQAFNAMVARLQKNEAQRRNWMADVVHELRTPLTVIQGNLEGLLDGVYPADSDHLTPILEETRVLSRLVDDLRTLSLAESGALKLQREPTDLCVLVSETTASFRAQATETGVELRTALAEDLPLVDIDPTRIREVLTNLIANALRYTPRGGTIQVTGQANQNEAFITLCVSDNGTGIPAEALPHIFDRFYKTPESGGTGLGLAIARDLVIAHGGEIFAESEPGKGTTIRFTLPQ